MREIWRHDFIKYVDPQFLYYFCGDALFLLWGGCVNLKRFSLSELAEFTSKSKLGNILEVSSRTVFEYHQLAMLIGDFEGDYPSISRNSKAITSAGLTKYQCWVMFSLMLACRRLARQDVANVLLNDLDPEFSHKFSKNNYYQMNPEASEYELTAV
jgi:hypothetical protein